MEGNYMASAILAAILSFLIPGLGQAYAGDIKKGIVFFIVAVIVGTLVFFVFRLWIYYIISLLISLYAAYDAFNMTY